MITERLFMEHDNGIVSEPSCTTTRQFSVIEENAIYFAAGYVVQKLIKKFRKSSDDDACICRAALLHMVGEDTFAGAIEGDGSYLEYVKVWTKATDRGGLKHASDDTYKFFLTLESRVYELIKKGEQKVQVVSAIDPGFLITSCIYFIYS